ncbi:hypothetical protein B0H66DRAFT_597054 [Apodospora peruviana]|uniref:Uncharacterized protein n=1 Tax=Apodospora peruviana TaxID=516989 RepID=A0AAE0IQK9_9PEZI|nr:hypothetical protein B0H66DRAFT_597054 [Apodospora peruviana]
MAPYTWSPENSATGRKISRDDVLVPKDQQTLLDRADAWSKAGVPNSPPDVLEAVRALYMRKRKMTKQSAVLLPKPAEETPSREHRDGTSTSTDERSTSRSISWSPSPVRDATTSGRGQESDAPSPTPVRPLPAPKPALLRALSRTDMMVYSSSAAPSESGLEVEVPRALVTDLEPVNRAAAAVVPEPTPPSAQIIPSTYEAPADSAKQPEPKRRRKMKPMPRSPEQVNLELATPITPTFLQQHGSTAGSSHPPKLPTLPPHRTSAHAAVAVEEDDQATAGSTPATFPTAPSPFNDASSSISMYQGAQVTVDSPSVRVSEVQPPITSSHPSLPAIHGVQAAAAATAHDTPNKQLSSSSEKVPPNGPPSQVPFTTFKLAYPDFKGSLMDFVRSVHVIKYLQKRKLLNEFLYDDLVRVFCGDYLEYIEDAETFNEKPLPIQEWYNENVSKPAYTKGVLRRANLTDVLDKYPNEVRQIPETGKTKTSKKRSRRDTTIDSQAPPPPPVISRTDTSKKLVATDTEMVDRGVDQPMPGPVQREVEIQEEMDGLQELKELVESPSPVKALQVTREYRERVSPATSTAAADVPRSNPPIPLPVESRQQPATLIPPASSLWGTRQTPTMLGSLYTQPPPIPLSMDTQPPPVELSPDNTSSRSGQLLNSSKGKTVAASLSNHHTVMGPPHVELSPDITSMPRQQLNSTDRAADASPANRQTMGPPSSTLPSAVDHNNKLAEHLRSASVEQRPVSSTMPDSSQQSNASSIAEPKRKKRRKSSFQKFLNKRLTQNSAPGSSR